MSEKSATLQCVQPLGTRLGKRAERAFYGNMKGKHSYTLADLSGVTSYQPVSSPAIRIELWRFGGWTWRGRHRRQPTTECKFIVSTKSASSACRVPRCVDRAGGNLLRRVRRVLAAALTAGDFHHSNPRKIYEASALRGVPCYGSALTGPCQSACIQPSRGAHHRFGPLGGRDRLVCVRQLRSSGSGHLHPQRRPLPRTLERSQLLSLRSQCALPDEDR